MTHKDDMELPRSLEDARILSMPESMYYIPNFITSSEEEVLLNKTWPSRLSAKNILLAEPLPAWLIEPVISRLHDIPVHKSDVKAPPSHVFASSPHGEPNHVLINEYQPGQGIMPHEDGAAYWPVVATVSLGAAIILEVFQKRTDGSRELQPRWRILQEARSLLITTEGMYTDTLHGISEVVVDEEVDSSTITNWSLLGCIEDFASGRYERSRRTSLTYRDVRHVSKLGSKLSLLKKH
ncbi:MAG: hypothetical protein M1833_005877 [Piccolia ochrophora]|nr:MAG: hypothetical protein M1833_005877 [Piccolia ochrophora]